MITDILILYYMYMYLILSMKMNIKIIISTLITISVTSLKTNQYRVLKVMTDIDQLPIQLSVHH